MKQHRKLYFKEKCLSLMLNFVLKLMTSVLLLLSLISIYCFGVPCKMFASKSETHFVFLFKQIK